MQVLLYVCGFSGGYGGGGVRGARGGGHTRCDFCIVNTGRFAIENPKGPEKQQ